MKKMKSSTRSGWISSQVFKERWYGNIRIACKTVKGKGNVFYGQEPPHGESTTTECGVNYQLLALMLLK